MPEKLEIDSGTFLTDIERHFRVMAGPGAGKTYWLVNHIKQVATSGGFRYAIVPMGNYGWDFLRISGGARGFLGAGYHPARQLTSNEYMSAAVFSDGTATYAAAQKLDQGSITSGDSSIQIYRIGTATDLTPRAWPARMRSS